MQNDIIKTHNQLQVKALSVSGVLMGIAGLRWFSGRSYGIPAVLALGVAVGGWVCPALIRAVDCALAAFIRTVGRTVSVLIMVIVYFTVITPLAVYHRICGKRLLNRRMDPSAGTYWQPVPDAVNDPVRARRQY